MARIISLFLFAPAGLVIWFSATAWCQRASGDVPLRYELLINGESFLVPGEQMTRLESKEHPGLVYQVALRIAPTQQVRLTRLRFEYAWPARVEIERRGGRQTANVQHELGYTLLVTDLGGPMDDQGKDAVLRILRKSTVDSFTASGAREAEISGVQRGQFQHTEGVAVLIRYRDEEDLGHVAGVYVLGTPTFSCYAIVHYLEVDAAQALPQIKAALNSIQAVR